MREKILPFFNWWSSHKKRREGPLNEENIQDKLDGWAQDALMNAPLPLVALDANGLIIFCNAQFESICDEGKVIGRGIDELMPFLSPVCFFDEKKQEICELVWKDRIYKIDTSPLEWKGESEKPKRIVVLYWIDITEKQEYKNKYEQGKPLVCLVQIDNYDEVMVNTEEENRPVVIAEVDKKVGQWVHAATGTFRKYDRDKFIVIFENGYLKNIQDRRFDILDQIRELRVGNKIPITLSIGAGTEAESFLECNEEARAAMQLALGRGGDQAVLKMKDHLSFYGGKTKAIENRSKVKSRVIAHALRELMNQSNEIIIMSHEIPDLDSIGAALGVFRCAAITQKSARIVLNQSNVGIEQLVSELKRLDEYKDLFITSKDALSQLSNQSLLVVVDTQRPSFTEEPKLLEKAERIVVIDHHRRGAEAVENATLSYLEPYASSTAELVTEIVQYFDDKIRLKPLEAEALLAGMTIDTKSFSFQTGVRTFEAAAYLRRAGADTTAIRQLFQDDLETFTARADVVRNAQIISEGIALSVCPSGIPNASLIAAQAADGLVTIRGITASFVLCSTNRGVTISGRSLGNINVQLILEKFGGGGHLTVAGAQIAHIAMEEAVMMVKNAVQEYIKEAESK